MPLLKLIAWPREHRERFLRRQATELPRPVYQPIDAAPLLASLKEAESMARRDDPVDAWLRRSIAALRTTATMLANPGTRRFSRLSRKLYGSPTDPFPGTTRSPFELARKLIRTTERVADRTPDPPEPNLTAEEVAEQVRIAVKAQFGASAPEVAVVTHLAARAAAGPKRIRLRQGAKFSDLDVRQLIQHEAFVHVATALNGRRQRKMPLLAANHAGTTKTQEGLAVFAELMSGTLDPRRLLRLAHRVVGVQMALDGADFIEVYRYFVQHSPNRAEAYESTTRIFRGGTLRGGFPFTKDIVYLDGLVRMHVFARACIDTGRFDALPMLFAGKFDLVDVPAVIELERLGLCRHPEFVPPWVSDPRRLVAYFALTDVIGHASVGGLRRHFIQQVRAYPDRDLTP
jgi:uncharacterized protein (TIGR02421 family)